MTTLEMVGLAVVIALPLWVVLSLVLGLRKRVFAESGAAEDVMAEVRGLAEADRSAEARLLADLREQLEAQVGGSMRKLETGIEALGAPRDEEVARIEKTLVDEVARIEKALVVRIEALEAVVREVAARPEPETPPAPAGEDIGLAVREALEPLSLRMAQIEDALKPVGGRLAAIEGALRDGRVESVEDALVRVLEDRGFRDVVVLEGPVPDGDRSRMLVEARRDGMAYKGPVFLAGGKVVEQRLNPSFPMFP